MDLALTSAEEAFRAYGEGRVNMPPKAYLTLAQGDFRAMYGEIFLASGPHLRLEVGQCPSRQPRQGFADGDGQDHPE